jgi:DNA polymerase-1
MEARQGCVKKYITISQSGLVATILWSFLLGVAIMGSGCGRGMGKYLVFDEETENHVYKKRLGSPFDPRNYIVARGWKKQGDKRCSWKYFKDQETADASYLKIDDDVDLLVGFNIKYDLLWEMRANDASLRRFFKRGGRIWDCQYAEYLLQAQHQNYQMCALDDIIESYGGKKKIDAVKALWEAGHLTSEINPDLLIDYLVGTEEEKRNGGDIRNTELIFLGQIKKASLLGMLPAIAARMDGMCATTEMEWNGLKVDVKEGVRRLGILNAELAAAIAELEQYIPELPDGMTFNWNSNFHKSALVFGGTVKYEKRDTYIDEKTGELARLKAYEMRPALDSEGQPVYFLSGKKKGEPKMQKVEVQGPLKTKIQEFHFEFPGHTKPEPAWKGAQLDAVGKPIYSTGADVIEELGTRNIPFLKAYAIRTALAKEIGTYYAVKDEDGKWTGMLTCVDPQDNTVHHKLNHTSTVTTRLSSSDPNLQNVPRGDKSEVKKMFVSRFKGGKMMEADYSQLEVVVQGLLSGDKQLCEDLRNKIDFHCKRVSAKYDIPYDTALVWCKDENDPHYKEWKPKRTGVKEFSFQRAYGAGAAAIAYATGLDIDTVKDLIETEDRMYPGIVKFNDRVEKEVRESAKPFRDPARGYKAYRRGYYVAPTGTRYTFRSYDAPEFLKKKGIADSFSPPELKNYPVQGTGGEIVQLILGKLWRRFIETDNYGGMALLVNTVHDCVWADYDPTVEAALAADVKRIMESVPELLEAIFGIECTVPFPVELECGPNMLELKHMH